MPIVEFEGGQRVEFDRSPSQQDIEEAASALGLSRRKETAQPKKKGIFSRISKTLQTAGDVGLGFGKGVVSTVAGASALGERGLRFVTTAGRGKGELLGERIQKEFRPEGTAEKIGFGVEQAAEFLAPGTAPTKVAKGILGAGKLAKGARLATRVGAEAAVAGGQTAIQRGDIDEDVALTAALGGAIPFAGAIGGKATKDLSGRIVNSLIKPVKRAMAYGKDPGRGVIKEGIVANTFEELGEKVVAKKSEIGAMIGEKIEKAPEGTVIDLGDIFNPIDDAIAQAGKAKRTKSAVVKRLTDAKLDIAESLGLKVDEQLELAKIIDKEIGGEIVLDTELLSKINPQRAFDVKQVVADITRFTGNPSDDEAVNKALKGVYGKLKGGLNKNIKGLEDLNERFADMTGADVAIKHRDDILQRQNLIFGFTPQITGSAAGIMALISTGQPLTSALVAGATGIGSKLLGTTAFKTRVAKTISTLGPDERRKVVLGTIASKRFFQEMFGTTNVDEIAGFSD
jgi:hypothetical protein